MAGVALLVLQLVSLSLSQKVPRISFISGPEVVTDLGSSVDLACSVENGKEYPIQWIKVKGEQKADYQYFPLSLGPTLVVRDQRFNISYTSEPSSPTSITVQIKNVKEVDDAIYQCQVIIGMEKKITKEVRLRVKTPVVIFPNSTSSLTIVEGQAVNLNCLASGFPAPSIVWQRTDKKVFFTGKLTYPGSSVKFGNVKRGDRGDYQCKADNNVGDPKTYDLSLNVRFGPTIRVIRPRIMQAEQYDVTLQCEIESFPAPAINWMKEGEVIYNNERQTVTHFTKGDTVTLSTLKIYKLTPSDYGIYKCEASNKHGEKSEGVELLTTNIPVPQAAYGGGSSHLKSVLSILVPVILAVILL